MKEQRPEWKEEPNIQLFLENYVSTKSPHNTASQYYFVLPKWVDFVCAKLNCKPSQIDYRTVTEFRYETKVYRLPIQTSMIQEFLQQISAPTTRQVAHKVLRVYFNWLVGREVLTHCPVPPPDYGSKTRTKKPGLKLEELSQLITAIHDNAPIEVKAPLLTQFAAGLRIGEVCVVRVRDIVFEEPHDWHLAIRREALKGYSQGLVPLPPEMGGLMTQYQAWRDTVKPSSDYLFVNSKGRKWNAADLNAHLKRIGSLVPSLRPVTTHDLRRGHATIMAEFKVPADVTRQMLRQKSTQTGFGYVRTPSYAGEIGYHDVSRLEVAQLAEKIAVQELEGLQ